MRCFSFSFSLDVKSNLNNFLFSLDGLDVKSNLNKWNLDMWNSFLNGTKVVVLTQNPHEVKFGYLWVKCN